MKIRSCFGGFSIIPKKKINIFEMFGVVKTKVVGKLDEYWTILRDKLKCKRNRSSNIRYELTTEDELSQEELQEVVKMMAKWILNRRRIQHS